MFIDFEYKNSGGPSVKIEPLSITANGKYEAPKGSAYTPIDVTVPQPKVEAKKTIDIVTNGSTDITPSVGFDGIAGATVNVNIDTGEKPRILNGTTFRVKYGESIDGLNNLNVSDYDWEGFDNIIWVFDDNHYLQNTTKNLYQDLFNECKKLRTKIKVINIYLNGDLDLKGVDLSECYHIYIHTFKDTNIDLSGCNLSNVEKFEVYGQDYNINVNLTGCVFEYLTKFAVQGKVQGFNDINFSNCLFMPTCWNDDIDFTNADLHNVKFIYDYYCLPNTKYPTEKINIMCILYRLRTKNITTLDLSPFNFENISNTGELVRDNPEITEITGLSKIRSPFSLNYLFCDFSNLQKIDLSGINMLGTREVSGTLSNNPKLTDVKFPYNIQVPFNMSGSPLLTKESLLNLIQGLYDFGPDGGKTFTIGSDNLAKLTAEEIAVATAKGWTLQ